MLPHRFAGAGPTRRRCLGAAAGSALLAATGLARAQAYPARPVRIIVPFASGAGDSVTRIVAQRLSEQVGQQFVVENRPGAGGTTGTAYAAKAAPDGYTVCFTAAGHAVMGVMTPNLGFDPLADLAPVGFMVTQPYVFAVRDGAPYKTVPELIAYAKAHPGEVKLAHPGVGTLVHLVGVWFAAEAGIQLNSIPYGSSGPALQSVLAGLTDVIIDPPSNTLPQLGTGKVHVMATTGNQRFAALPDAPTLRDLGMPVNGATWFGLSVPARTPPAIVEKLNTELVAALRDKGVKARLEAMHYSVEPGTAAGYGQYFAEQTALWTKVAVANKLGKAP